LNGETIAHTANMHRTYRFPVRRLLVEGSNELVVTFASAVKYADRASLELGYRPHMSAHPHNAIRKMACSFGWDWGPDTATAGIWRPVALHGWSGARLASVRPIARVDEADAGIVEVHVEVERGAVGGALNDCLLEVTASIGGLIAHATLARGESSGLVEVAIPTVERWWPRGYGEQPLYDISVDLGSSTGEAGCEPSASTDNWSGRVGFRDVRLDMLPDEHGTSFQFVVNDQPVYIRGANWIPDDAFPHRVTRERYAARIAQAERAGINLLRVWGGGIYEADDFFELCDERGILTWQDFLFACAAYSEDEPLRSEVLAEARDNILRLLPHPSLVLWNGNNENIRGFHDWNWEPRLDGKNWGLGYYTELLPDLVSELDPDRPYTPGSPWSGTIDIHPNDPDHGSMHIWDLWNQLDYPEYRRYVSRFVAEFGWQGPPTWATLTEAISDDPLTPESPGMIGHQKAGGGHDKLVDGLVAHFAVPGSMEDWHWAMSLNQANAIRLGVEHFRSWSPRNTGTVIWQLNDCWPVTSWAMVDGAGREKPHYHAVAHAYADRLVTIQPREHGLVVAVVNDFASAWNGTLVIERRSFAGAVLAITSIPVSVDARGTATLDVPADIADADMPDAEYVVATVGSNIGSDVDSGVGSESATVRGLWFFAEYRDSQLEVPKLTTVVLPNPTGCSVQVTAENLVRDLTLLVDRLDPDAVVDSGLVTLLPGESVRFEVVTNHVLDRDALSSGLVLRSANQLVINPG
ncbi:MAG: glycoside hydrolase family 2 protein, partial [Terrimesophilobacter sp.]